MAKNAPRDSSYCVYLNNSYYCLLSESYLLITVVSTSCAVINLQHYAVGLLDNSNIHYKNEVFKTLGV